MKHTHQDYKECRMDYLGRLDGYTNFPHEIDAHEGNDWLGMFFAGLAALVVATIIIDVATNMEWLHYWIASWF